MFSWHSEGTIIGTLGEAEPIVTPLPQLGLTREGKVLKCTEELMGKRSKPDLCISFSCACLQARTDSEVER